MDRLFFFNFKGGPLRWRHWLPLDTSSSAHFNSHLRKGLFELSPKNGEDG